MPYPQATDAPFELDPNRSRWLYDTDGRQYPIVAVSRRSVVIARHDLRIELKRRRLERVGYDTTADGDVYRVTRYDLPEEYIA